VLFFPFLPFLPFLPFPDFFLAFCYFSSSSSCNLLASYSYLISSRISASIAACSASISASIGLEQSVSYVFIAAWLTLGFHVGSLPFMYFSCRSWIVVLSNLPMRFDWISFSG
jgi:hypothetical protein